MSQTDERIERLESQVREQAQIIDKLQNMLRIAANYQNEDVGGRLDGVQAALLKAGEVKARNGGRRR